MQNPDRRPLPNGWTERYDASRNNWYYVQINATPPRTSYQHPADMEPARSQLGPSGGFVARSAPPPPPPPPCFSGMPTPGLISSPISQTIPRPGDPSQIPSMPSPNAADSYKNKLGLNSSMNSRSSQYGSTGNGRPTTNVIPEAPAFQAPRFHKAQSYQVPSPASCPTDSHPRFHEQWVCHPHPENTDSEAPAFQPPHLQRAQSHQIPRLPTDIHHPHKSDTYPANISAHSSSSPSSPHSSTTAQPPSQSANVSEESISHIQTTVSPPSQPQLPSPPYSEESFGSSMGSPSPPPSSQGVQSMVEPQGREGSTTSPPISPADATQSAALAAQLEAAQRAKILKQVGILVGKTAGKAALKIAGNAALLSVGIPPSLAVGVGTLILNSNEVAALVNAFFASGGTGVNLSTLLAVLQGQPGADYQGVINALKLQQQQLQGQPQAPLVLTELTRILLAAAQQQAPSQQHISKTSNRTLGAKL